MNAIRLVLVGTIGILSACGSSQATNLTAAKASPKDTPTVVASRTPDQHPTTLPPIMQGLFHARLNMSQPVYQTSCGDYNNAGPPTVAENIQSIRANSTTDRAIAVATVVRMSTPVWNTPDGHRWTQAEINAGTTVDPSVYTPFVLKAQRVLGNSVGLTVGETITGYLHGGQTPYGDLVSVCYGGPVAIPQPGWSVVAIFGGEVDTPMLSPALHRPIIEELDIIKDGAVQTEQGRQSIP